MPMSLYVGNLSYQTSEDDLTALFAPFGTILSVRIPIDRETRRPRGFAFVEMERDDGLRAVEALDRATHFGRVLNVTEAIPKPAPPARPSRAGR